MRSAFNTIAALVLSFNFAATAHAQRQTPPVGEQQSKPAQSSPSTDDAQLYRSSTFGFRFQIPYGWVDRSAEMQKSNDAGKSELLLAVFERPPKATGETINSAVVIASESVTSYPGLKTGEDYLGPLTELATSAGFKADGDPYQLVVEARQLWRADFVKTLSDKVSMKQCTLVLLAKGHIVSFTFIAGSDEALDELMDGLHFGAAKPGAR